MRIETEEDFMKMALATAMAIEMSPIIKESMLAVYDFALEIETKHGHKTTVEDMVCLIKYKSETFKRITVK